MLPENHTDKILPIDTGCGRIMKGKIGAAMEKWLEEEKNLDKWQNRLSAKDRTILMTQWTGEEWSELSNYETFSQSDCVRKLAVCEEQMAVMM